MFKDYIQKFKVADAADNWFGIDKAMHLTVSFAIAVGFALVISNSSLAIFGFSIMIGLAKEFLDAREGGSGFSYKDLIADILGILIAIALV